MTSRGSIPGRASIPDEEEEINSKVKKMKPHVPGTVIFADHNRQLPWMATYHAVVMFADISGFTALCEKYGGNGQSGVDQLTRILNEYLGAVVEGILGSDGDILKFAGDAILAIWRVGRIEELVVELPKVVNCCLDIQEKCGEWDTDIGVKLTIKIGLSAGEMSITFLGNQEYRHYVELGPAVKAVNTAESFCRSGYVVMSPEAWMLAERYRYEAEILEDQQHVRIFSMRPVERNRSASLPTPSMIESIPSDRKMSLDLRPLQREDPPSSTSNLEPPKLGTVIEILKSENQMEKEKPKQMKGIISSKLGIGQKFGKLRKVVETVTEMRLDIALRLYILHPVLKKLDDNQPLEYLSEMRKTSIVFMNLVLDEEKDTATLLQKIFELVYTQTKSMHGCLNKVFLFDKGCTFLIIFGLPGFKHEKDSAHALLSSGRMKTRLDAIPGVKLVSIGVTTGMTFCGVIGHPYRHEYSVIGRKVNMAARLMMHYPNKVTCDNETFQKCRLPTSYFAVLVTKQMKGVQNVGIIRELLEQSREDTVIPKSIKHSDYPMLGRHVEEFLFREQVTLMRKNAYMRKHLVFSGAAGIGKTKLLDHLVDIAEDQDFRVVSCRLELDDSSIPYFIAGYILRSLLCNCGVEAVNKHKEKVIDNLSDDECQYLYLLNDVMGFAFDKPPHLSQMTYSEKAKRRELLHMVSEICIPEGSEAIIVIDDAHNIDTASWEYMSEICSIKQALVVLGLRPIIIEKPTCKEAFHFIDNPEVRLVDLGSLDLKFMAPLACQMMDVVSIPKDLDKILRERSHGVPSWCLEILKDILDKKQLIVVLDDGRAEFRQSAVIPNMILVKPCRSGNLLKPPSQTILKVSVTDMEENVESKSQATDMLESLGYSYNAPPAGMIGSRKTSIKIASTAARRGLHFPKFSDDTAKDVEMEKKPELERIAIFVKGVMAEDIPVPVSMKELIIARLDSMRVSDQLLVKCAAVLGMNIRKDILEMLLPKAHRPKMNITLRRIMESSIFMCSKTPVSHGAQLSGGRDETMCIKYRCYCPKEYFAKRSGEIQVCPSPKFVNSLLQQTAYECLMEQHKIELHTKAARYFEMSADEYRNHIPYYILAWPPPDYLQEALEKSEPVDPFVSHKRSKRNQVMDESFSDHAEFLRVRRGRRRAVCVRAEEAIALVDRIVEKAIPIENVEHYILNVLPLYHCLVYHWKCAGQPLNVLCSLLEQTAAALAVRRNAKAEELLQEANTVLKEQAASLMSQGEAVVYQAKIYRLRGKILFKAGRVSEAYEYVSKAAQLLSLQQPINSKTKLLRAKLLARFFLYWKFNIGKNPPASFRILEQGYCLTDLYAMDREHGHTDLKLIHALQQFMKVAGRTIHLHQIITAYSCMIECCWERSWFDISDSLEVELLRGCAARHYELFTEDRSILGGIYARRCIAFFQKGELEDAENAGRAASEICIHIQDLETTKLLGPYYFFLCFMIYKYENCIDLMHQFRFSSQVTDDKIAKAIFYTLCLEVAMAGGCPFDTVATCLAYITKYLRTCDAVAYEITTRYYIAMTAALWFAKREQWAEVQAMFDYWEIYESTDSSFFSLLGRANKIQCMLHSFAKCLEVKNNYVANILEKQIQGDLYWCSKIVHKTPVLQPRLLHLSAYFYTLKNSKSKARRYLRKAMKFTKRQGNKKEEKWMINNRTVWTTKPYDVNCNEKWKQHMNSHCLEWLLKCGLRREMTMYTLPIPCSR